MKNIAKILCFVVALVLAISVVGISAFADGETVVEVASAEELKNVATAVNSGTTYEGQTIKLTANIVLSDEWTPIGNGQRSGNTYTGNAFKGIFDGNGYSISGLTITETSGEDVALGLFGVVDGGSVKNLTLNDVNINVSNSECAGAAIGVLVGGGVADNVTVNGAVSAKRGNGGIVGRMLISGTISNCVNNASLTATGGANLGGIVGAAYYTAEGKLMTISNCVNNGTVIGAAGGVGGIVGLCTGNVTGCENNGVVIGANASVGGIVGEQQNYGIVSNNVNNADVNSTAGYGTGGIVGWVRYNGAVSNYPLKGIVSVTKNENNGSINGGSDAGGIVGTVYNAANVSNNINKAEGLTAPNFAAGIVGNIQYPAASSHVIQGTSSDSVTVPKDTVNIVDNVSTTAIENITASCKHLYAYDNSNGTQQGTIENNNDYFAAASVDEYDIITGYYTTLSAALGGQFDEKRTVIVLRDVTENIEGFYNVTLVSGVEGGVTITNTNTEYTHFDNVTVDTGVTVNLAKAYSGACENSINGTLNVSDSYLHTENAYTYVNGTLAIAGELVIADYTDEYAGIFVNGDWDPTTVNFTCSSLTISSGAFCANDEKIECVSFVANGSANINFNNSIIVASSISIDPELDSKLSVNSDGSVTIVKKNYVAEVDGKKYETLQEAIKAAGDKHISILNEIAREEDVEVDAGYKLVFGVDAEGNTICGVVLATTAPEIGEGGYWYIGGVNTGAIAVPNITIEGGYWYINGIPTYIVAEGYDGHSPKVEIGEDGYWYIDGEKTDAKGRAENGVGIEKIEKVETIGNVDKYEITFTDGSKTYFTVANGINGSQGLPGIQGPEGLPGDKGNPGAPGLDGDDGSSVLKVIIIVAAVGVVLALAVLGRRIFKRNPFKI